MESFLPNNGIALNFSFSSVATAVICLLLYCFVFLVFLLFLLLMLFLFGYNGYSVKIVEFLYVSMWFVCVWKIVFEPNRLGFAIRGFD